MRRTIAIACVVSCALTAIATAATHRAVVALVIDGLARGDSVVLTGDDGDVLVPAAQMCAARLCRADMAVLDDDGTPLVSLRGLGRQIRSFQLDEVAGTLTIAISPDAFDTTTLSLRPGMPGAIEYPDSTSLFVNYALHGDTGAGSDARASAFTEAGLSIDGALLYSSVAMPTPGTIVRGLSNATFDWRKEMVSFVAGDEITSGGVLGGGGVIGGVHVMRDFALDPYFISQPTLTQTGTVTTPSTVEIYRDGVLVERTVIQPGPFRIQDVTGSLGADTQVVIRDSFGLTQQILTTSFVSPPTALAAGLHEFDYSLGALRMNPGVASFDYGAPALLAVHRYGVTNMVTIQGRVEATPDLASGGGGVIATRGRTSIELDAGASGSAQGIGSAASVTLAWHKNAVTFSALVRAVSKRYATTQLAPFEDRARGETVANVGYSYNARWTFSAQLGASRWLVTGDQLRAGVTAAARVGEGIQILGSAAVGTQTGVPTDVELTATLSWQIGTRTVASAIAGHDASGVFAGGSIARPLPIGSGYGYLAQAQLGATPSAYGRFDAQSELGRASVTLQYQGGIPDAALDVAGGIVAIGGRVKLTRPVDGGFALLRVPGAANVEGYLENQPMGKTDREGDLVITQLQPYFGNHLRVDLAAVPIELGVSGLERIVAPPRRGGVVVQLAERPAPLVRGIISATVSGHPVDASFGELVLPREAGNERLPLGDGGVFEIESLAAGRHHATVELDGRTCTIELDVHGGVLDHVELGAVPCKLGENPR